MKFVAVGFVIWMPGAILWFISHGNALGFYPTDVAAFRGSIGLMMFLIGFSIFLFGLLFPAHEEPPRFR